MSLCSPSFHTRTYRTREPSSGTRHEASGLSNSATFRQFTPSRDVSTLVGILAARSFPLGVLTITIPVASHSPANYNLTHVPPFAPHAFTGKPSLTGRFGDASHSS